MSDSNIKLATSSIPRFTPDILIALNIIAKKMTARGQKSLLKFDLMMKIIHATLNRMNSFILTFRIITFAEKCTSVMNVTLIYLASESYQDGYECKGCVWFNI